MTGKQDAAETKTILPWLCHRSRQLLWHVMTPWRRTWRRRQIPSTHEETWVLLLHDVRNNDAPLWFDYVRYTFHTM